MSGVVEVNGWRLRMNLPPEWRGCGESVGDQLVAIADDGRLAPMRRSRRATTYNFVLRSGSEQTYPVFTKIIDRARGLAHWKQAVGRSTAAHVASITADLCSAGFASPPVWVWADHPASGRQMIVTPRAPGFGPLRTLERLASNRMQKRLLLRALGEEIARLHRAGFIHGDLTPFNLFVIPEHVPRFVLLDHERTRRCGRLSTRNQLKNLVQLGRFALPSITLTDRLRVLRAYALARPLGAAGVRRVVKMLDARISRAGGLEPVALVERQSASSYARS